MIELSRRRILTGLIAAPAVLRLGLHMPIHAEKFSPDYSSWNGTFGKDLATRLYFNGSRYEALIRFNGILSSKQKRAVESRIGERFGF